MSANDVWRRRVGYAPTTALRLKCHACNLVGHGTQQPAVVILLDVDTKWGSAFKTLKVHGRHPGRTFKVPF